MRRRDFINVVAGSAITWPVAARAQQPGRVRRIALLMAQDEGNREVQGWLATFRDGLARLGWVEGQNLHFEFQWTGSRSVWASR